MIEDIYKNSTPVSLYQPSKEVADVTALAKNAYQVGDEILNRSWTELNNYSVISRMNKDQRTMNAFVDEDVEDPNEAWKYRGTRSKARNKAIAEHANLTAAYLIPTFIAQNEDDEMDVNFSEFMRDIVEWMTLNSNYQSSFLTLVFGMLTNPVTYLGAEYAEVMQTIKEKGKDGKSSQKEIIDEVLSGFQAPVLSADQVLISNAYERDTQRQARILKRRYIEYEEAKAVYGKHKNFGFLQPGMKSVFNADDGLFYDVKDDNHPTLVEEVILLSRRDDCEIPFVGGIYFGDDDIEENAMKHRDNRNAPKYNITPFGYNRIGEHFYFYKSLMNVLGWDNALYDAMSEVLMNRAFLEVNMPVAVTGTDKIDSEMIFPSAVVAFEDKDSKVIPLLPPGNIGAGFSAMNATEQSMSEGSVSDIGSGQLPAASTKAYTVAIAQQNASKIVEAVGKSLGESVTQFGSLMADIAISHLSIPQVDEIVSGVVKLKYRSFLLENKTVDGKRMNKMLRFDESLLGAEMTDEQKKQANLQLLEQVGYPDNKHHLYLINPNLFSRFKYLARADYRELLHQNEKFMQAMLTNLYMTIGQDPLVDRESLLRKLLYSFFRSGGDELLAKKQPQNGGMPMLPGTDPNANPPANPNNGGGALNAQIQAKALSTAMIGT